MAATALHDVSTTDPTEPRAPAVALRTYRFLRLSVVGVIVMLMVSICLEYHDSGNCLRGSISTYYYSPVRSVFVGALCAIGLVLIALWGKTAIEDALFNLAGMLAPVVAFVPAKNDGRCLAADPLTQFTLTAEQRAQLLAANRAANQAAITNNMRTYLGVVFVFLFALVLIGAASHLWKKWPLIEDNKVAYWVPLVLAAVLWWLGRSQYVIRDDSPGDTSWFYQNAHFTSAIVMFVFITLGILWVGITRYWGNSRPSTPRFTILRPILTAFNACLGQPKLSPKRNRVWAWVYIGQALAMLGASVVIFAMAWKDIGPQKFLDHHIFWIEAWMVLNVAVFWSLQTKERWNEGAPPRTRVEMAAVPESV